jgi:hypothetical protein
MADGWARVFAGFDGMEPPADLWEQAVDRAAAGAARPRRAAWRWRIAALTALAVAAVIGTGGALRGSAGGGASGPAFRVDKFDYGAGSTPGQGDGSEPGRTYEVPQLGGVSAVSQSDAWIVGTQAHERAVPNGRTTQYVTWTQGVAWHWEGRSWSPVAVRAARPDSQLMGVAAVSPQLAWAVGDWSTPPYGSVDTHPLIERWTGSGWAVDSTPAIPNGSLAAVSADSARDAWAVGSTLPAGTPSDRGVELVLHWTGRRWLRIGSPLRSPATATAVQALAPDDVWLVASGDTTGRRVYLQHWDGRRWALVRAPFGPHDPLLSFTALSATDAWAFGSYEGADGRSYSLAAHWNGRTWSIAPTPNQGEVFRRRHWITVPHSTPYTVNALTMSASPGVWNVWALGTTQYTRSIANPPNCRSPCIEIRGSNPAGLFAHWNGLRWQLLPPPPASLPGAFGNFTAIAPSGPSGLWVIGTNYFDNFIELWNGHRWRTVPHPPDRTTLSSR